MPTDGEATPLLPARDRETAAAAHSNEGASLGTKRFPFHPTAPATPLWRKISFQFFDRLSDGDALPLDERDLWHLDPQFRGTQAAADLKKHVPTSGRARWLRGVWAVNRTRLLRLAALNALATPLAALRPLLLYYFFLVGLSRLEATTARHSLDDRWDLFLAMGGIVVIELLLELIRRHAALVAAECYLQLSASLSTMITESVVTSGVSMNASSDGKEPAHMGRKQRLTEITNTLTNSLNSVGVVPLLVHSVWPMVVRLVVSMWALVCVVNVSWVVVCAVVSAYALLLLVEITAGTSLARQFETAFARRLNTIHESVMSIRMIKMNAWEDKMERKIHEARALETAAGNRLAVLAFIIKQITTDSPTLFAALVFEIAASMSSGTTQQVDLTPTQVFTALVLIHDGWRCIDKIKVAFRTLVVGGRAWRKVEDFLASSADSRMQSLMETPEKSSTRPAVSGWVVTEMRGVCLAATTQATSGPPLLINVDWILREGELVVIHGAAGIGKSVLLTALLGFAKVQSGSFQGLPQDCRVAYCSQDSWLQTQSIRDNILFGTAFEELKYWAVVEACRLLEDLAVLPDGDMTAVGPRGINLSSGQTARIALARACYADADLYLLDCPLANVDAVVQSQIFRRCIVELLLFKTVVIVTHNPEYIGSSFVDQLVEVSSHGVRATSRLAKRGSKTLNTNTETSRPTRRMRDYQTMIGSRTRYDRSLWISPLPKRSKTLVSQIRSPRNRQEPRSLIDDKKQLDTFLSSTAIRLFLFGGGVRAWAWVAIAFVLSMLWGVMCICRDLWIINWRTLSETLPFSSSDETKEAATLYAALVVACMLVGLAVQLCLLAFNVASTGQLFSRMVHTILRAPMTFFYATPLGDMLNPFFTDLSEVDMLIPQCLSKLVFGAVNLLGRALVVGWILGPVGFIMAVAGIVVLLRAQPTKSFVELTHYVRISNARQLSLMTEVLDGENVLRAFGEGHIAHTVGALQAAHEIKNRIELFTDTFNSYSILREETVLAVLSLGQLAMLFVRSATPGEILLVLLYVLMTQQEYVAHVGSGMANTCDQLYSIERLRHFGGGEIETESSSEVRPAVVQEKWPENGEIVFEHVDFTYSNLRENASPTLALHDVSFSLRGGEKVGIIGRTGSGKSSLAMALLRVHPLRSGRILLDGVDLRTVPLSQLRRSITMIPQSPTFYRCSVRDYLDPFHEFDDARLWSELLTVELGSRVQSLEEELLDNGENWSLGQRQLLCFARALLKPSRVVVLDESFSCVDQSCQEKILRIVRDRMSTSTVILITHRLDQILTFDRILVMSRGRLVESGSASELASDPESLFYEFLETSLLTL